MKFMKTTAIKSLDKALKTATFDLDGARLSLELGLPNAEQRYAAALEAHKAAYAARWPDQAW